MDIITRPLGLYLDQEFTDILEKEMTNNGMNLAMEEKVVEFVGKDGKVSKVVTDKENTQLS